MKKSSKPCEPTSSEKQSQTRWIDYTFRGYGYHDFYAGREFIGTVHSTEYYTYGVLTITGAEVKFEASKTRKTKEWVEQQHQIHILKNL